MFTGLHYTEMAGDACLFGSGQNMVSRIFFACGNTELSEVVYESYYDVSTGRPFLVCRGWVRVLGPGLGLWPRGLVSKMTAATDHLRSPYAALLTCLHVRCECAAPSAKFTSR